MSMSKTIVIVGVTGTQGGSVARTFLQFPQWRVRGITRNPSSSAAQGLVAEGVEIVQGDLDDKQSLIRAFEGATAIFSNTDFFTHLFHGLNPDNLPAGGSVLEYAHDREVMQGMNIADAAESPAVLSTLENFVLSSLSDAVKWSGGKYRTVYHFNSKAEMIRLTQERCPGVASKMSTVILGHYVTQWRSITALAPKKQRDGSYLLSRNTPAAFKMPLTVTHRDTGPFVKALIDMPPRRNILAVSEYMTFSEYMEVWGRVHGVKAGYKEISRDDLFQGFPEPVATEIADSFDFVHEFGYTGGDPSVLEPEEVDSKIPRTSIEEYIRAEDWTSVLES